MEMFVYLKVGLSFVLCFVGAKMLMVDIYKIPIGISLGVVGGILILSVVVSLLVQRKEQEFCYRAKELKGSALKTGVIGCTLQAHPCLAKFGC